MFFFNLGLGEFLALLGVVSGLTALLYLLDRSRQKVRVATLRFWQPAPVPTEQLQRKKIQQPWSLLLQILSMGLLLLAIAQLRWGTPETGSRDHVLVMDTSSWMAARIGRVTYMDQARMAAKAWLDKLPANDRVMLARADAVLVPVTAFESKREVIRQAIDQSRPGAASLRLNAALDQASAIQRGSGRSAGEVVYAGAGRVSADEDSLDLSKTKGFRLLPARGTVENLGIRRIAVHRAAEDAGVWRAQVTVRNYGTAGRVVPIEVRFGGSAVAVAKRVTLAAGAEQEVTFDYRTRAAGLLEARIFSSDGFAGDDRAILELPSEPVLKVKVCTPEPELWRPLLAANSRIEAVYTGPLALPAREAGDVAIYDRCPAQGALTPRAIVIGAPGVRTSPAGSKLRWRADAALAEGIRSQDVTLEAATVYLTSAQDQVLAETAAGAVMVASGDVVRMGFHPLKSALRYELATPILFANVLRALAPESFRRSEVAGASVGMIQAALDDENAPVQVLNERGQKLPFTRTGKTVRFFVGDAGTVRLNDGKKETAYSLTLPEVGEREIEWPKGTRRGVPAVSSFAPSSRDLWYALAVLGALGLLADWLLFGLGRRLRPLAMPVAAETGSPLRRAS